MTSPQLIPHLRDLADTFSSARLSKETLLDIVHCLSTAENERHRCLQAVADEPELPGRMPDEMWTTIRDDRDAVENALKITVQKTKSGIIERMGFTIPSGAALITAERTRQIHDEGWTPEHDHGHDRGQLIDAALSYLRAAINPGHPAMQTPPQEWPWEPAWWKPADHPIRNLVKAGALIAAEIDRLTHTPPTPTAQTP